MCKLIHGVRTASLLCIGTGYVQFRAEFDLVLYVLVLDHSNHDKLEWPPLQISVKCCEIDEFLRNGEIDLA